MNLAHDALARGAAEGLVGVAGRAALCDFARNITPPMRKGR
jgi:hypothetical protein